jgi:hypothetical protein
MKRNLCGDNIGKNLFAVFHNGGGTFIAGSFNAKDFHVFV